MNRHAKAHRLLLLPSAFAFLALSHFAFAETQAERRIAPPVWMSPNYSFVSYLDFYGNIAVSEDAYAHIWIAEIFNSSNIVTTGSLRIELWALSAPYSGGSVTGHVMASIRTNQISGGIDHLGPGQAMLGTSMTLPYTPGNSSQKYQVLFLEEYENACSSDGFCISAYLPADMIFRDGFAPTDDASP